MQPLRVGFFWKRCTFILLALSALVLLPFIGFFYKVNFTNFLHNTDLFRSTVFTTILFAVISSFLLVLFSFLAALALTRIKIYSKLGRNLSLLVLPVALGNISIAFIAKLLFGESIFFSKIVNSGILFKLAFISLLYLWQYGTLFIYLFWLQMQNIPRNIMDYATASKFSKFQVVKDIYLPKTKNLWILLSCIGLTNTLFEESKMQYLFKASPGNNSELITSWMHRNYQSTLLIGAEEAKQVIFNSGAIVTVFSFLTMAIVFTSANIFFKRVARSKFYPSKKNLFKIKLPYQQVMGLALLAVIFIPLIVAVSKLSFSSRPNFSNLIFSFVMTLFATILSVGTSIFLGASSRMGWKNMLSSFNNNSLLFFTTLFLLLLIPPVIILQCGYSWMASIGYTSELLVYTVWISGHTILCLPMLGSFVLLNHFRVTTNEIIFNDVNNISKYDIVKYSFILRFKAEYCLLFLIGFSFIWNEGIFNNLFSDYIPSFATGLKMLITGRSADYSMASGYLFLSVFLALCIAGLWRILIEKQAKANEEN